MWAMIFKVFKYYILQGTIIVGFIILACPSSTVVTQDDIARAVIPPKVYPPIAMMALSFIAAMATCDLPDDNDAIFLHDPVESLYTLIVAVAVPSMLRPPTITGGEEQGTKVVQR